MVKMSCLQGGSNDGTLELLGTAGPLLGHILLKTLLVLPEKIGYFVKILIKVFSQMIHHNLYTSHAA